MTVVKKEITVNAPRETVWRYFADPDLLAGWLMRNNFTGKLQKEFQFFAQPAKDWTTFDLYVAIDAEPSTIMSSWSTINGMESFFVQMMRITGPDSVELEPDTEARPGDRFVWRWHNGRRLVGEYLQAKTKNEVQFTFGDSKVSVVALPYKTGSLLRLRQYDIPDTQEARMHIYGNCRAAWVYFLTVLKTLLEHGVDGRDKTRETGASFSTYFNPSSLGIEF